MGFLDIFWEYMFKSSKPPKTKLLTQHLKAKKGSAVALVRGHHCVIPTPWEDPGPDSGMTWMFWARLWMHPGYWLVGRLWGWGNGLWLDDILWRVLSHLMKEISSKKKKKVKLYHLISMFKIRTSIYSSLVALCFVTGDSYKIDGWQCNVRKNSGSSWSLKLRSSNHMTLSNFITWRLQCSPALQKETGSEHFRGLAGSLKDYT